MSLVSKYITSKVIIIDYNNARRYTVDEERQMSQEFEEDISEEELEAIAKSVYERLEQEWDNRSEHFHGFMIDTPPWVNLPQKTNSAGVGMKVSFGSSDTESLRTDSENSVSDIENQLDLLSEEIYFMLKSRIEREKERYGCHATYWHHQNFW